MAEEVIMLGKGYDEKKCTFPCIATEKLDGVAADFWYVNDETGVAVRTRQNKPIYSVDHILDWLDGKLPQGCHLIGELYIEGQSFKDISGAVRRGENNPELVLYIYDWYNPARMDDTYEQRIQEMAGHVAKHCKSDTPVRIIQGRLLHSAEQVRMYSAEFMTGNPEAEGLMIRPVDGEHSKYKFGRSWGMLKLKMTETHDLKVVSFEEAKSKEGQPLGMVGRINVEHSFWTGDRTGETHVIGCGPGKLTHAERKEVWLNQQAYIGKIAEVKAMPDGDYNALREPRFIRWRDDKTEPNQE